MSTPGPETQWFNLEEVRSADKAQLNRRWMWTGVGIGLFVTPGIAMGVFQAGKHSAGAAILVGVVAVVIVAALTLGVLLAVRRRSSGSPDVLWLGVGSAGIWRVTAEGTSHSAWDQVQGVVIHSELDLARQRINLDLLGPSAPVAVSSTGVIQHRVELPDAVIHRHMEPPYRAWNLATGVGGAIRTLQPRLWRGFTINTGVGGIEFQSWDSAVYKGASTAPTWNNFGGNQHRPPH